MRDHFRQQFFIASASTGANPDTNSALRFASWLYNDTVVRHRRSLKLLLTTYRLTAVVALALIARLANAQTPSNWNICTGDPRGDWDRQISSCTALIGSGKEANDNLATAYYNRALAYENNEDYAHAVADYSEAIRLNPNEADALVFRSLNREKIGDKKGAEADMAAAKRIDPKPGN
jgi:tetratricopeptide (TPR) repeat protein